MFTKLFPNFSYKKPELPEPTPQLALGALLVRAAMSDHQYKAVELAAIDKILAATFDLGPIEAAKLRATCEALERDAPGTTEFATLVRENVDYDARVRLASAMWRVLLADNQLVPEEEQTLHQIEKSLGISDEDSARLERQALGTDNQDD